MIVTLWISMLAVLIQMAVLSRMGSPRIASSLDTVTPDGRAMIVRGSDGTWSARVTIPGVASYEPSFGAKQVSGPPWWAALPDRTGSRVISSSAYGWPIPIVSDRGSINPLAFLTIVLAGSVLLFPILLGLSASRRNVRLAFLLHRRLVRFRRIHLCRRCAYDLRGLDVGSTCPECGEIGAVTVAHPAVPPPDQTN